MTLCDDCVRAELEPWAVYWRDRLCCRARSVAETPRVLMAKAYAAAIDGLSAEDAAALRDRAYALVKAREVAQ